MSEGKRVPFIYNGRFGTVDEADVPKMPKGTRVLSKDEAAKRQAEAAQEAADVAEQERYDALPTARKVLGGAATVAQALSGPSALLTVGSNPDAPPEAVAYNQGVTNQLTAGLTQGLVRQGIDAAAGKPAGDRYAQQVEQQRTASPTAYLAGQIAGAGAGVVAPVGNVAEAAAATRLGGLAARGAAGRAAATALELGARGAAEGAVLGAGDAAGEALLQDHELAADKIAAAAGLGALYGGAGGAVLGGAGSLIKSVAGAALQGIGGALARGESATATAGARALAGDAIAPGLKNLSNEMAADALNATKVQMRDALEFVAADQKTARRAVGEYLNRQIIGPVAAERGALGVGMAGRADDLLTAIQADKSGRIAAGLSEAIKGTPARFDMAELAQVKSNIVNEMLRDPTKIAGAEAFANRTGLEMQALVNAGKIAADGTIDAADAFYARSQMAKQAYELGRVSGAAGDAYKSFLREWDRATIDAIDRAAQSAGKSDVGNQIRYWKREWQLASAAEKMATGGAERIMGNNAIGLREGIAGATAVMTGHAALGVAGTLGMKVVKERGKAVAAYALGQLADRAATSRLVAETSAQIERASKGLLVPAPKGAAVEKLPPVRASAKTAMARVAAFQADPEAFIDHASRQVEPLAVHSPEIADGIVTRQVRAMTFLASKVPVQPDRDPLDPHPAPKMTANEEAEFARYAYYAEKPERFFAEVARGRLTPEGAETAQALMPRAFAELQQMTAEALTTQLARGNKLPYRQRELLGHLLDFAATPSQRPEHRAFLQQNVSDVLPSDQPVSAAPAASRRATNTPSGSPLNRLEAGGIGSR